jgi:molybdopterin molybdotransferase
LEIDAPPSPGKIVGSNSYLLAALVKACGAVPLLMGIARDDREDLQRHFQAARQADLILSSGGVSAGDFDLVKDILKSEGNRLYFWQVAMKPGRPMAFGSLGSVPVIALPGSPGAVAVCFEQFVRPVLRKMQGHGDLLRKVVMARLSEDIAKERGIRYFLQGEIRWSGAGQPVVSTVKGRAPQKGTSGRTCGLIIFPEEDTLIPEGAMVQVQLLEDVLGIMPLPEP